MLIICHMVEFKKPEIKDVLTNYARWKILSEARNRLEDEIAQAYYFYLPSFLTSDKVAVPNFFYSNRVDLFKEQYDWYFFEKTNVRKYALFEEYDSGELVGKLTIDVRFIKETESES